MKYCIDCNNEIPNWCKRCTPCRDLERKRASKLNKDKYKYHLKPENIYKRYIRGAEYRKFEFELTFEHFMYYWQLPCYYCGDNIETIGLDRLNNTKGYSLDNIVSCCTPCNMMKHNNTEDDFIARCKRIAKLH